MTKVSTQTLVLASGSPRRKELLEKAGLQFEVFVSDIDETPKKKETPKQMVARLSREKARAVHSKYPQAFVLAADTTVVSFNGKNLGKPADHSEASRMIQSLQGKLHRVYTGYTILFGKKSITRVIETKVKMRKLDARDIEAYIATGECMDKAGAYAAQGHGMVLIEKILGSYTNVVGLPTAEVLHDLKRLGFWK